ncbi:MAG: hypothetical protein ACFB20_12175 [Opitutales bacterium]
MNHVKARCLAALILCVLPFAVSDAHTVDTSASSAGPSLVDAHQRFSLPEPVLLGALGFVALSAFVVQRRRAWSGR